MFSLHFIYIFNFVLVPDMLLKIGGYLILDRLLKFWRHLHFHMMPAVAQLRIFYAVADVAFQCVAWHSNAAAKGDSLVHHPHIPTFCKPKFTSGSF